VPQGGLEGSFERQVSRADAELFGHQRAELLIAE
jgi:hypothetical protein